MDRSRSGASLVEDPTAVTTVRRGWVEREAAMPGAWAELKRLARRARRRWLRTLSYALVIGALTAGAAVREPHVYTSRVAFGVSGGGLEALIAEHDLYPALRARDPRLAVVARGDDLDVEVRRSPRARAQRADVPRSVRLDVTVHGRDAARVYQAASQLGRLLREPGSEPALRWELLDAGRIEPAAMSRPRLFVWIAVLAWCIALPLCAIGVGAFDPHVYDLEDVRRLGMPTVGAIRRFDGDNAGALVSRLTDEPRAPPAGDRGTIGRS